MGITHKYKYSRLYDVMIGINLWKIFGFNLKYIISNLGARLAIYILKKEIYIMNRLETGIG